MIHQRDLIRALARDAGVSPSTAADALDEAIHRIFQRVKRKKADAETKTVKAAPSAKTVLPLTKTGVPLTKTGAPSAKATAKAVQGRARKGAFRDGRG